MSTKPGINVPGEEESGVSLQLKVIAEMIPLTDLMQTSFFKAASITAEEP
jgi:hypothetical protein